MQGKRFVQWPITALFLLGMAFSLGAAGVGSLDESKFYTSHEGHTHLGTINLASGEGADVGEYRHRDLEIDRWKWFSPGGALYRNHFYTFLNRRPSPDENPPRFDARLARVNVHTGKIELLGEPISRVLVATEVSYDGQIYATSFVVATPQTVLYRDTNLYRVDRKTAEIALVGDTGIESIMDLAFDPLGRLWATVGNELYILDLVTGAPTPMATITGVPGEIMGIGFTSDGELYGTAVDTEDLYQIDPGSGAATVVGRHGFFMPHGGDIPMVPYDEQRP